MNKPLGLIFAGCLMLVGCSNEVDTLSPQKDKIVSYLTATHVPQLRAVENLEAGSQQPYYTMAGDAVYRYIGDSYNPDRDNWPEVTRASRVTISFRAYVFTYANIVTTGTNQTMPFYTNDPALKEAFHNAGLNTEAWSFEPLTIDMAHPDIIKGLYDALLGCREGDYVESYMTYTMAYGNINFSTIPKQSPIAYFFTVNSVE